MKKPKIAIVIPCWKRADVFALVSKQLELFNEQTKSKIELDIVYIFSEDDPEILELYKVYKSATYSRTLVFSDNNLLGEKLNKGIDVAMKLNCDYIMNFGSDDLIHPNIINLYLPYIYTNKMIIGISALYFYEPGKLPIYFHYYNNPHIIGAARLIHKSVVKRVTEKFGGLYSPEICRGMDTFSAKRMLSCGFFETAVYRGEFPYIVDIKTDTNINSFAKVTNQSNKNRFRFVPLELIESEYEVLNLLNTTKL